MKLKLVRNCNWKKSGKLKLRIPDFAVLLAKMSNFECTVILNASDAHKREWEHLLKTRRIIGQYSGIWSTFGRFAPTDLN